MFITISGVVTADVANNGTMAVSLPTAASVLGNSQALSAFQANWPVTGGDFYGAANHRISFGASANQIGGGDVQTFPQHFDVTLAASTVTITNKSGVTWKAGQAFRLQLEMQGYRFYQDNDPNFARKMMKMAIVETYMVNLGMPAASAAVGNTFAGTTSAAGVEKLTAPIYLDVPRNVNVASSNAGDTGAWSVKFTGTDVYGQAMSETLALNGTTSVSGNKAFATITSAKAIHASGTSLAGTVTITSGNKLGLPVATVNAGQVLKEIQDGANAVAGTFAYALRTGGGSTATTADVRGTYTPNTAPNGSITYQLLLAVPDAGNIGCPQFAG